jgi:hypothetical protein
MIDYEWAVAPDQVAGVLETVDRDGQVLETAVVDAEALTEAGSSMVVSGRRVMDDAWRDFMSRRELVPGKLIALIAASAAGVADGVVAITAGDDEMAAEWRYNRTDIFGAGFRWW